MSSPVMTALGCGLMLALYTGSIVAQVEPATSPMVTEECPAQQVPVRAGTYVALVDGILLRLQVKASLDDATLIVNQVDGNRLYDRRYWKPVQVSERCGERSIDYQVEAPADSADPAERRDAADADKERTPQRMRLVLQPALIERRPGIPRPVTMIPGSLLRPDTVPVPLQFEEVVIRREIGAG